MALSSEESQSLSPASRVLAIADKVADEVEKAANSGDSEGQHDMGRRAIGHGFSLVFRGYMLVGAHGRNFVPGVGREERSDQACLDQVGGRQLTRSGVSARLIEGNDEVESTPGLTCFGLASAARDREISGAHTFTVLVRPAPKAGRTGGVPFK